MIEIPKQLQREEFRFVLIKPKSKVPFEDGWQKTANYKFNDKRLLEHKGNYGTIGGFGFLINLDCDKLETVKLAEQSLPETFTVQRKKGKRHYRFICKNQPSKKIKLLKEGEDFGEIQTFGGQMIGPNCKHKEGDIYKVVKDLPIAEVSLEQLKFVYKEYIKEHQEVEKTKAGISTIPIQTVLSLSGLSKRGNEYQGEHPIHGSKGGLNFCVNPTKNTWHCFRHDTGGDAYYFQAVKLGILDCSEARPGALRGDDFIKVANSIKEIISPAQKRISEIKKDLIESNLIIKNYKYFEKLKKDKSFLVESFLYPKSVTMLFSRPGEYKSILSLYLGVAVANGKPFLEMKTKKHPVLICDRENSEQDIKTRLMAIRKGLNIRSKKFPLSFIVHQGDLDTQAQEIQEVIIKHKIKLVIFDTLHRFAKYEENSADEINHLYTNVFQPIVNKTGCAILFLHHANKQSGDYRGSGDFLGMVDVSYKLTANRKKCNFTIENIKCRRGEVEEIAGEIDFGVDEDVYNFKRLEQSELRTATVSKFKDCTAIIKSLFGITGDTMKKSDITTHFELEHQKEFSNETIKRCLRWLVRNGSLKQPKKGDYVRMWTGEDD